LISVFKSNDARTIVVDSLLFRLKHRFYSSLPQALGLDSNLFSCWLGK